jgi:sugar (pentulose or hexulose) kinase
VGIDPEVTFTGGVSRNIGMVKALEQKLGLSVNVCDDSHYIGAIGAAIFALERALGGVSAGSGKLDQVSAGAPKSSLPIIGAQ